MEGIGVIGGCCLCVVALHWVPALSAIMDLQIVMIVLRNIECPFASESQNNKHNPASFRGGIFYAKGGKGNGNTGKRTD